MFTRFSKKDRIEKSKATGDLKPTQEPKTEVNQESLTIEPAIKVTRINERTVRVAKGNGEINRQNFIDLKAKKKSFVSVEEYGSVSEIRESIDKELAETKNALGEYLRHLYDRQEMAEKMQRLRDIIGKIADKKPSIRSTNLVSLNGIEIVLGAKAFDELTAIESVVKSHQQRLVALQKVREALQTLDEASGTEGIKYLTFEKERIPEQILLKIS